MIQLIKQASRIDYFYKEFYVDTDEEVQAIETKDLVMGSLVYVISNGNVYMLNGKKEWILQ